MSWIYQGKEFKDSDIPEGAIGFIYQMSAIIDGKSVSYIGKKNFYSETKKAMGKKALAAVTDKRLKKYTKVKKLNYANYYSSNNVLKQAYKDGVVIKREILMLCYSATQLTYYECKWQFKLEVLENDKYLNSNILGKFFKIK